MKNAHKTLSLEFIPTPMKVLPSTPTLPQPESFKCFICPDQFYLEGEWEAHQKLYHSFKCTKCGTTNFITRSDYSDHVDSCQGNLVDFPHRLGSDEPDPLLDYPSDDLHVLHNHPEIENRVFTIIAEILAEDTAMLYPVQDPIEDLQEFQASDCRPLLPALDPDIEFACESCPFRCQHTKDLEVHESLHHVNFECDNCEFQTSSELFLRTHQVEGNCRHHTPTVHLLLCPNCGLTFDDISDLKLHTDLHHSYPQDQVTSALTETVNLSDNLKEMKDDISRALEKLAKGQQLLTEKVQELIHFKTNICDELVNVKDTVEIMSSDLLRKFENLEVKLIPPLTSSVPQPVGMPHDYPTSQHLIPNLSNPYLTPCPPQHSTSLSNPCLRPMTPCERCGFKTYSEYQMRKHLEVRHYGRNKLLYVGDEIAQNVDFKYLENKTKTLINPLKAFTSTSSASTSPNPLPNFKDVVFEELSMNNYRYLVLGPCSTDLSLLETSQDTTENLNALEERVLTAAKSMFSIAETSLEKLPALEKVILMNMLPRFDPVTSDPLALKPQLVNLFNSFYSQLWSRSQYRSRIYVCDQSILNAAGHDHHLVYGYPHHAHYDGVHLRGHEGTRALTRSVQKILINSITDNNQPYNNQKFSPRISSIPMYNPMQLLRDSISSNKTPSQPAASTPHPLPPRSDRTLTPNMGLSHPAPLTSSHRSQPSGPCYSPHPSVPTHSDLSEIVIEIPEDSHTYSVPTQNRYELLGNY